MLPMTWLFRACGSRLSPDVPPLPIRQPPLLRHRFWLGLAALVAVIGATPAVEAAPRRAKAARATKARNPSTGAAVAASNVAVFAFGGQDTYSVHDHVVQALVDRGLRVNTTLRPIDTDEQFRDLGAVMDLAVYVHGHVKELPADHAVATIVIRSGVTGRKITTVSFTGYRRGLPFDVEEKLWQRVGPAVTRACMEAKKPRPHTNRPTHIEAGTPL
jgi:hypothetical protein